MGGVAFVFPTFVVRAGRSGRGAGRVGVPVGGAWTQRVCPPAIKGVIDWRWEPELEAANAAHAQRTEAAKGSERGKVKH